MKCFYKNTAMPWRKHSGAKIKSVKELRNIEWNAESSLLNLSHARPMRACIQSVISVHRLYEFMRGLQAVTT